MKRLIKTITRVVAKSDVTQVLKEFAITVGLFFLWVAWEEMGIIILLSMVVEMWFPRRHDEVAD